jgi:hypothetical protein
VLGGPDSPGRRFRGYGWILFMGIPTALFVVALISDASMTAIVGAGICLLIAFAARVWFIAVRVPRWKRPDVVVNGENLVITDVTGATRTVAWSDMTQVSLKLVTVGMTDELHLEWTTAVDVGADVNLGDTLDPIKVRDALAVHAPVSVDMHAGPERGVPA